jgi:hypothetical protein
LSILASLAGPELLWVAFLVVAELLARRNRPPTEAGSDRLQRQGMVLAPLMALASFAPWFWVTHAKGWLILRILVSGVIGMLLVSLRIVGGVNYQDSRNSGLLGTFIMVLMFGWLALAAGLIGSLVVLWRS